MTHSNPTLPSDFSKHSRDPEPRNDNKDSQFDTVTLKLVQPVSCSKIFDKTISKKNKTLRDKSNSKEISNNIHGNSITQIHGEHLITKNKMKESELFETSPEITVDGVPWNYEAKRDLYKTIIQLQEKHQYLEEEAYAVKMKLGRSEEDYRAENILLHAQIENLQQQLKLLKIENAFLEKELAQLKMMNDTMEEELTQLQSEGESLERQLPPLQVENVSLEAQLMQLKMESESLEGQLASAIQKGDGNVSTHKRSKVIVTRARTPSPSINSSSSRTKLDEQDHGKRPNTLTESLVYAENAITDMVSILKHIHTVEQN